MDSNLGGPEFKTRSQPTSLGFYHGFPQSSRKMLGWIFITTIHLTIIHQLHIFKIKITELNKWNIDYTTINIHSLLVEHPKILILDMTKLKMLCISKPAKKCSYRSAKNLICLKYKDWSKIGGYQLPHSGVLITSADNSWSPPLPFHTALKIHQLNIFTLYQHSSPSQTNSLT